MRVKDIDSEAIQKFLADEVPALMKELDETQGITIVLPFGPSGTGKSLLLQMLLEEDETRFHAQRVDYKTNIQLEGNITFAVGDKGESKTFIPKLHRISDKTALLDLPGFDDTRKGYKLLNAILVKIVLSHPNVRNIKPIILLNGNYFDESRLESFRRLLGILETLLIDNINQWIPNFTVLVNRIGINYLEDLPTQPALDDNPYFQNNPYLTACFRNVLKIPDLAEDLKIFFETLSKTHESEGIISYDILDLTQDDFLAYKLRHAIYKKLETKLPVSGNLFKFPGDPDMEKLLNYYIAEIMHEGYPYLNSVINLPQKITVQKQEKINLETKINQLEQKIEKLKEEQISNLSKKRETIADFERDMENWKNDIQTNKNFIRNMDVNAIRNHQKELLSQQLDYEKTEVKYETYSASSGSNRMTYNIDLGFPISKIVYSSDFEITHKYLDHNLENGRIHLEAREDGNTAASIFSFGIYNAVRTGETWIDVYALKKNCYSYNYDRFQDQIEGLDYNLNQYNKKLNANSALQAQVDQGNKSLKQMKDTLQSQIKNFDHSLDLILEKQSLQKQALEELEKSINHAEETLLENIALVEQIYPSFEIAETLMGIFNLNPDPYANEDLSFMDLLNTYNNLHIPKDCIEKRHRDLCFGYGNPARPETLPPEYNEAIKDHSLLRHD